MALEDVINAGARDNFLGDLGNKFSENTAIAAALEMAKWNKDDPVLTQTDRDQNEFMVKNHVPYFEGMSATQNANAIALEANQAQEYLADTTVNNYHHVLAGFGNDNKGKKHIAGALLNVDPIQWKGGKKDHFERHAKAREAVQALSDPKKAGQAMKTYANGFTTDGMKYTFAVLAEDDKFVGKHLGRRAQIATEAFANGFTGVGSVRNYAQKSLDHSEDEGKKQLGLAMGRTLYKVTQDSESS